jgi:hypothetical protein
VVFTFSIKNVKGVCYDEFVVHSGDETPVKFKVMVVSVVNLVLLLRVGQRCGGTCSLHREGESLKRW